MGNGHDEAVPITLTVPTTMLPSATGSPPQSSTAIDGILRRAARAPDRHMGSGVLAVLS